MEIQVNLRPAQPQDAKACGEICHLAFKGIAEAHNFPPDFPNAHVTTELLAGVIARDDVYTVVAESGGKVIGSNVLWENGDVAGLGPITVAPDTQKSSAGRQLMLNALERAESQGLERVRLVQAAFNNLSMALYSKLGFDVREPLSVMQGTPLNHREPGCLVRRATQNDIEACNQLCQSIHGHRRQGELADAVNLGTARVVERDGEISGYATAVAFFGHAIGRSDEDLKALIGSAEEFAGPGFLLPTRNARLLRWCLDKGLKIVQPMTLMSRGPYQEPAGSFLCSVLY